MDDHDDARLSFRGEDPGAGIIDWYQSSVAPPLRITSRVIVEIGPSRRLAISA